MAIKQVVLSPQKLRDSFRSMPWCFQGKVTNIKGTVVEARLPGARVGTVVSIEVHGRSQPVLAEVVGFQGDDRVLLLPYHQLEGCAPGCIITVIDDYTEIPCGDFLLGRVVDPFIKSLGDEKMIMPNDVDLVPLDAPAPDPMKRQRVLNPLSLGIKAIDSLLTMGLGQRVGVMAGSGVGKSVLLGMMARNTSADINVIGLIGERGREVREFIEKDLGQSGLKRSIIVTVTSDQSPLMKIRGAKATMAIAEYFSRRGKNVLLMMDSVTRVAMAQREIGGAIGEPPTTKGYTPSVFSLLPKLLERSGPQLYGHGSISGIFTVLVDGDDFNDPIADAVRSILDGHINLSRDLASRGHFPAIEVSTSASRVMNDIVKSSHLKLAQELKGLIGTYQQNFDLIQIGVYREGSNPQLDRAVALMPRIQEFLTQSIDERCNLEDAVQKLQILLRGQPQETIDDLR